MKIPEITYSYCKNKDNYRIDKRNKKCGTITKNLTVTKITCELTHENIISLNKALEYLKKNWGKTNKIELDFYPF